MMNKAPAYAGASFIPTQTGVGPQYINKACSVNCRPCFCCYSISADPVRLQPSQRALPRSSSSFSLAEGSFTLARKIMAAMM